LLAPLVPAILDTPFARDLFTAAAIHTVAARPADLWRLAWPMANLALWGQRWWGGRGGASADAHLSDLAQTA
jgi:hypothetical protein